jgi:hypothetical protein
MRDRLIKLIEKEVPRPKADALAGHLLANGVIVPPCKVGDKVYLPCLKEWGNIENYTITEFELDNGGLWFVVDDEDREAHPIEIIGKEVFLTKEEAEAKLKELKK